MIRDNVKDMTGKLAALGITLCDDVPNKDEFAKIAGDVLGIVMEAPDFVTMPQADRAKAISLAFIEAGSIVAAKAIKFSDEVSPA
jgi:hypothetical protein